MTELDVSTALIVAFAIWLIAILMFGMLLIAALVSLFFERKEANLEQESKSGIDA